MILYLVTQCWMPVSGFFIWSYLGEERCVTRAYDNPAACETIRRKVKDQKDRLWSTGSIPKKWLSISMRVDCEEKSR